MIKVWNKKDDINGVKAEDVIKSMRIQESDEIFLVIDDVSKRVTEIQFKGIICSNYNIDVNLSCEEVGNIYAQKVAEEQAKEKEELVTVQALKEENDQLKQCILEMSEIIYS